ncbi:unknown [Paraprevotella clara CAG:116]|nr:unknown [Paraprevotella clara CAG:116]
MVSRFTAFSTAEPSPIITVSKRKDKLLKPDGSLLMHWL